MLFAFATAFPLLRQKVSSGLAIETGVVVFVVVVVVIVVVVVESALSFLVTADLRSAAGAIVVAVG
jgi:hypothetical protein